MSDEVKKISVMISGIHIPVNVTQDEESLIREIETEINDKLLQFKKHYKNQSDEKLLAMLSLTYAMKAAKSRTDEISTEDINERLTKMVDKLASAL